MSTVLIAVLATIRPRSRSAFGRRWKIRASDAQPARSDIGHIGSYRYAAELRVALGFAPGGFRSFRVKRVNRPELRGQRVFCAAGSAHPGKGPQWWWRTL